MPLTPATTAVPTSEPFNFSALRPVGDTFDLNAISVNTLGMVIPSDSTLIAITTAGGTRLVEFTMTGGDPTTLVLTPNQVLLPGISVGGGMAYDRVNSRIYFTDVFGSLLRYVDVPNGTLGGASLNPVSAPIVGTWAVGVSRDGTNLYLSEFTAQSRLKRYTFGVPGDITTIALQQVNNYHLGSQLGSIMVSDDSRRIIMTALSSDTFGVADFRSPNNIISGGVMAPNPVPPSRTYQFYPFGQTLNFSARSPDGTYLFLNSLDGGLTRFNMV